MPYVDRNQFDCPSCEQYNGFTEDGDYNKDIRAQYSPKYNNQPVARTLCHPTSSSHGLSQLCDACNRSQELKVHQLASFTPTDSQNYDQEVELYKEQLEEMYRLCPGCERIVKRRLNQAKTLLLGMKRTSQRTKERKRGKVEGLAGKLKRIISLCLILLVIFLLTRYFISSRVFKLLLGFLIPGGDFNLTTDDLWTMTTSSDSGLDNMGYRLALGLTILVLLGKGEPMNGNEYLSVLTLCCLHFIIGEGVLKDTDVYQMFSDYLLPIEWFLRCVALLSSIGMFVDRMRWSPESAVKLNDSFHRIEVEEEQQQQEEDFEDSRSMSYLRSSGGGRLDTSTDFGSVFEYPQSVTSTRRPASHQSAQEEDEEIRNISLNSRSFHNRSDPMNQRSQYATQNGSIWDQQSNPRFDQRENLFANKSPTRSTMSQMNLHSPSKLLFPDDRFSNSIKSMRIGGEYHQLKSPEGGFASPSLNPFMKNMPMTASNSHLSVSSATLCGSNRSLLTPSRLSLASHCSAFTPAVGSSWAAGGSNGFWNNQYPNVFTRKAAPPSFAYAPSSPGSLSVAGGPKSLGPSHSLDNGLNERFVPLTESRSSSQSSGFESRQSTSSVQLPAFTPIAGLSPGGGGGGGRDSVFSGENKSVFSLGGRKAPSVWSEKGSVGRGSVRGGEEGRWLNNGKDSLMGMGAFLEPDVFPR